jgi:hypothetical protein
MKKNLTLLFLINVCLVFSQNLHEYYGAIKISDTTFISYRIYFQEEEGSIQGYSITDIGGDHETKSELTGSFNSNTRQLEYKEFGIVYTKSPIIEDDFCYINFTSEKFDLGRSKAIKGIFKGLFSDSSECINGEIQMTKAERIAKRTEKVTKKLDRTKRISDEVKAKVNPLKLLDTLNMNVLRKDQVLSVFTKSRNVNLVLNDNGKEDGDMVRIFVNDKLLLDKYVIQKEVRIIPLFVNEEKLRVKIVALNNGTISPNTMNIVLSDGHRDIDVLSNLKQGESAEIDILPR